MGKAGGSQVQSLDKVSENLFQKQKVREYNSSGNGPKFNLQYCKQISKQTKTLDSWAKCEREKEGLRSH
jgi:hypothetical protein